MSTHHKIVTAEETVVHFVGTGQQDMSLCGHDLAGDSWLGWEESEPTSDKVTCKECIRIVEFCKKLKRTEYVKV